MLTDVELRAYREARREGHSPVLALYAVRPAVLDLEEDYGHDWIDADSAGTFTYRGRVFHWQVQDPQGECFCYEEALPAWRDYKDRPDESPVAIMSPDEVEATTHRLIGCALAVDDGSPDWEWLGSVCSLRRTPVERRLDDRYLADTFAELAEQAMDSERRQEESAVARQRMALFGV